MNVVVVVVICSCRIVSLMEVFFYIVVFFFHAWSVGKITMLVSQKKGCSERQREESSDMNSVCCTIGRMLRYRENI